MSVAKDLVDAGVSEESARLAQYQFEFLQGTGVQSHVETYQNLVNETVIAARDRILAYYKDKIEFDEDIEFLEQSYIPEILQANLDAITRSFDRNFGAMLGNSEEYQDLVSTSIESSEIRKKQKQEHVRFAMEEQAKGYSRPDAKPQEKPGIISRIKSAVKSFFDKPTAQATTSQRGSTQRTTAKKQGIIGRAVSAVKSFFKRR